METAGVLNAMPVAKQELCADWLGTAGGCYLAAALAVPLSAFRVKPAVALTYVHVLHFTHRNRTTHLNTCQSSWLQIRRPGFDSRHYQKKKM
jgi:hypothetical protein